MLNSSHTMKLLSFMLAVVLSICILHTSDSQHVGGADQEAPVGGEPPKELQANADQEAKETVSDQNVALYGRATHGTLFGYYGDAVNAIDGNKDSNALHGSCSITSKVLNPWWRVDLRRTYRISRVAITNRGDCCSDRLNGAEIRIGNSLQTNGNNNPLCGTVSFIPAGETVTFTCNGMVGRWVNVVIPGRAEYLTLCEVEVYAVY